MRKIFCEIWNEYETGVRGNLRCKTVYDIVFGENGCHASTCILGTSSNYIYSAISIFTNLRHGTFARLPSRFYGIYTPSAITKQNTRRNIERGNITVPKNIPLSFPRNYQDHVNPKYNSLGIPSIFRAESSEKIERDSTSYHNFRLVALFPKCFGAQVNRQR